VLWRKEAFAGSLGHCQDTTVYLIAFPENPSRLRAAMREVEAGAGFRVGSIKALRERLLASREQCPNRETVRHA